MAEQKGAMPNPVISTEGLPREEWLAYRRKGIGGSDAAAVLGISPFRTGVDLYYDKLGQSVEDDEQNWVAKEMGAQLEDLVARIFAKKTGLAVCPMPVMFQHAEHPWMLADVDRLGRTEKPPFWSVRPPTTTPGINGSMTANPSCPSITRPRDGTTWRS